MGITWQESANVGVENAQSLSLQKQLSLTSLALDCPHLLVVNLVECDSLANSVCEVLSDGGGCPRLNSLTLESCEVKATTVRSLISCLDGVMVIVRIMKWRKILGCRPLSIDYM